MAIPFFRKGKEQEPEANPRRANSANKASSPETVEGATRLDALSPDALASAIIVEEVGTIDDSSSATDEAAILYANGQLDQTETTLKSMLDGNIQKAWAMLFDLYRVMGRSADFEQLALDYTVKFEASPPMWRGEAEAEETSEEVVDVAFPATLDSSAASLLDKVIQPSSQATPLRLDFSQTTQTDPDGAESIARILNQASRSKRKLQISGIKNLIKTLQEQTEAGAEKPGPWLLLLAIYQLLGRQEEFEDTAVNYAVRLEVSPPSWESVTTAKEVAAPKSRPGKNRDICVWNGVISGEKPKAYSELMAFSQNHNPVVVDLSDVTRIEYGSVSGLISTLMGILGNGKSIILQGHNSLIDALLQSLGVQHMAQLKPAAFV